ncbi:MAG: CehA/McbA family metallohydrolase [Chloroflexota bacterium]|nr:CehA/McbA family metallohydrolase [Chloroflexota bacterium]
MLIDLHNHTWPRSHDSVLDPEDLVVRAKELGLDGLCLTEHDTVWNPADVEALAEKHSFLVIPGVEVSTDDGHILAYGVERYVFGMHRVGKLAQHVKERGGCLVVAHPYRRAVPWKDDPEAWERALERAVGNPAIPYCVAMEVLNGRGSERENRFSLQLTERLEMPGTAGTDSHATHDIGKVATYFESDRIETWQDLVRELESGRFCAVDMATGREYAVPVRSA